MRKTHLGRLLAVALGLTAPAALAANTSGIHGPVINPDDKSAQIRFAMSSDDESSQDYWATRLHYQQALNADWRARIITQFRDRGNFQYEYLRAELLYHFKKSGTGMWDSGVRFEARTRRGSAPEEVGIQWTNQWQMSDSLKVRGIVAAAWEIGDNADTGTNIETRFGVKQKLDSGLSVGVELFSEYGQVGDFADFNDQEHQFGPVLAGKLDNGIKYEIRYLAGLTGATRDHNLGLRFNKAF